MQIEREKLVSVLTKIKPGLGRNEIIEQSTHYIFNKDCIYSYNDMITIVHPFESEIVGTVPAEEFYKLLQKFSDETLEITQDENEISIKGENIEAGIKLENEIKIDPVETGKIKRWLSLPNNFDQALKLCLFSASKNMVKPEFSCIYVKEDVVVSCDNFRASRVSLDKKIHHPLLIPALTVKELIDHDPISYQTDSNWLHFKNKEDSIFSIRIFSGEYPDISDLFNIEGNGIILPSDLAASLDKAQILTSTEFEQDMFVTLKIEPNHITCRGEGVVGWVEERVKIDYEGPDFEIKINPLFLEQVLNHTTKTVIGDRSILFQGDNFEHVISLTV
jgi:DNA polymerase III sliding clamp (beta) subunit (PCNA family)